MKKIKIQRHNIVIMCGLCLSLFSLVILHSYKTAFSFLTTAICYSFGFVGFWVLTPFLFLYGIYLMFRSKLLKFKLGLSIWGVLIIVLSLMVITSNWATGSSLRFNNCIELLKQLNPIDPFTNTKLGGGFFGYVIAGLLNNSITPIGTSIFCWVLVATGLILIFNKQVKKFFVFLKNRRAKNKVLRVERKEAEKQQQAEEERLLIEEQNKAREEAEQKKIEEENALLRELRTSTYNSTHGLSKPVFGSGSEITREDVTPFQKVEPITAALSPETESVVDTVSNDKIVEESPKEIINEEVETFVAPSFVAPEPQEEPVPEPTTEPAPAPADPLHRPQPKAIVKAPYAFPPVDLLEPHESADDITKNESSCQQRTDLLNQIFTDLRIGASIVGYTVGPSVTRFDVKMNASVSSSVVARYVPDLSIRLNGVPTRFEQIVPGQATSGLEIPNEIRTNVGLFESMQILNAKEKSSPYEIIFGKNISGDLITADLTKFPHMLVSGTTGSGKSIFMHATIMTLIMRNSPETLKLLLIDPKKVEMSYYKDIPHLLCPNISDPRKALVAFNKLVTEMERRYNLFEENRVRDIGEFNAFAKSHGIQPLPVIIVFIDEYADLNEACKDIRTPVVRIAQKARSAGINLVIATQRPSVNVIDGVIRANVPAHVALMTSNSYDSQTIIGEGGAESLLGNGDMLIECSLISRSSKPRVQGCFVSSSELNKVCDYIRANSSPEFDPFFMNLEHDPAEDANDSNNNGGGDGQVTAVDKNMQEEELYKIIKDDIMHRDYCSISYLTRTYGIGFPKAGRLFSKLIQEGRVAASGDARGSKVLIRAEETSNVGSTDVSTFTPDSMVNDDSGSSSQEG